MNGLTTTSLVCDIAGGTGGIIDLGRISVQGLTHFVHYTLGMDLLVFLELVVWGL